MGGRFYLISPFIGRLKQWIHANKRSHPYRPRRAAENGHATEVHATSELDAHPSSHDILGMGGEHGELPSTPERRTYAQPANHYVESPTKTPSAFSTAADGAVPLFPDSSSLFPTFSDDKARAPKASSSSAPSGAQATATTEGLKALLGLGGSSAAHEQAAASVEFPGLGARMIAEQGDERGRQLLDLLRGAGGPASGLSGSTKAQDLQGDERAQGAAPLLAALSAGAGVKESEAPAAAPHAPQEAGALFDLLRGGAPARSPPPHSNSPLPAPRAQNTAQVNNLLALLSPATSSFSISAHESRKEQETPTTSTFSSGPSPSMLGAPPTTSYLQHHPQVKDSAEQERAHKRAALLAALADPGPAPSERSLLGSVPTDQQVLQTPRVGPTRSLVSLEPRTSLSPSQVRAKGMLDMITGQTPLAQRAGSDSEHATPRFEGASAPAPEPAQEPLPAHYFPPNPNPNPQTADEAGAAQLLAMRQGANQPGVKGAMPDPAALLAFLSGAAGAGSTSPSAQPALPATLPAMQSGQDADWVEAQSRERAKAFRFPAPPAGVAPPSVSDQARQQQHPSVHGHSPVPVSASQQSRSPAHLPVNNNAMNGQHAPSDDRSSALLAMLNGSESAGLSPQVQTRQAAPLPGAQQGVPRSSLQPHQQQQQQQQTGDRSSALLAMLNGNGTGGPAGPANGPAHHSPLMMPRAPAGPAGPTGWPRHGGQPPSMPPMFGHSSGDPPPTAWATAGAGFVPPLQGTQHPGMGPMGPMGPVGPMSMPMGMGMGMGMPVGMGVGGPTHPAQHPHQHPHPHMPPHSQPPPLFNQAAPPEAGHGAGHGAGAGRAPIAGLPSTGGGLSALDVLMRGMSTG